MNSLLSFRNFYITIAIIAITTCINYAQKSIGNPVNGGEIYIELEPDDDPCAKGKTDHLGIYHFKNLSPGRYKLLVKLPGDQEFWHKKAEEARPKTLHVNFEITVGKKTTVSGSKTGKEELFFESASFTIPKGLNSAMTKTFTSVNNYGINDEGIK